MRPAVPWSPWDGSEVRGQASGAESWAQGPFQPRSYP